MKCNECRLEIKKGAVLVHKHVAGTWQKVPVCQDCWYKNHKVKDVRKP